MSFSSSERIPVAPGLGAVKVARSAEPSPGRAVEAAARAPDPGSREPTQLVTAHQLGESSPLADAVRPEFVLAPDEPVRWDAVFGNARPVELEIGSGKGGFMLRRAQSRPDRNFLGIEWANEFYRYAVDRMRRWRMANVRLLRADAAVFMKTRCPSASLHALHIYHPDPWPKRRHWKRRLFQPAFLDAAVRALVKGGRIAVQTDHAEYFAVIRELIESHAELRPAPFVDPEFGVGREGLSTNFEVKYAREGREFYRIAAVKAAPSGPSPAD